MDADPKNDPTYPMKKRNNGEHAGYSWERPPQQPVDRGGPALQRAAQRHGRLRDLDAALGAERHAPPLRASGTASRATGTGCR